MKLKLISTLLLASATLFAAEFPIHKEVLDNGMTVLLYPNK